jgi:dTDP-4-dehydrorhamnose 3,5-epimerase-like enzyme
MKIIKLQNNFKDKRGSITDIFYNMKFNHVSLISSKKKVVRGNNYFKNNTQYIYNLTSDFEYWFKKYNSKKKPKKIIVKQGWVVITPSYEAHAIKFINDNKLLEFSTLTLKKKKKTNDSIKLKLL